MSDTSILDSRYSWTRLVITLAIAVVGNVGIWAIIVIMPAVQAEFAIDRADASLPFAVTMIGFALGNFAIGRAVDRFGVTPSLIAATVVLALSYATAAIVGSIIGLTSMQFLIGFTTAVCFAPLIADISHWFDRRRGIAVAIVASGNYLSGAIWPLVLAGILQDQGWRTAYLIIAATCLIAILPLALCLRRSLPQSAAAHSEAQAAQRRSRLPFSSRTLLILLGLAGIGCCVAMSMPQVHIVSYCVDLGYGPAVGAEMLSLMLFGGVVSRLISGALADRLGGIITVLIGSALQCIALFLYLPAGSMVSLYLVSAVFGLAQGGIVPSYAVIVREYLPAREAGEKVGFVIMTTIFGMAIGGWMSGWIYDMTGSYQLAFINGIGWNFLNIAIMALLLWRARPGQMQPA